MTATRPIVSVVIPTYNRGDTIIRAVESALIQAAPELEVIVVDDASTDNTLEVLKSITDPRLRTFLVPHGGVAAARNFGVSVATGEWVAFLDSDDWWHPDKLTTVLPAPAPQFDVIGHDCVVENSMKTKEIRCGWKDTTTLSPLSLFYLGNRIATSAVMIRREILQAEPGPFDARFSPAEDYELWVRLAARKCRFHFINQPLTHYFTHNGQLTSNPVSSFSCETKVVQVCAQRWGTEIEREIGHSAFSERLYEGRLKLAQYYLRIGDRTSALRTIEGIPLTFNSRRISVGFYARYGYGCYKALRSLKRLFVSS